MTLNKGFLGFEGKEYRYTFNGKELDPATGLQDYGFRIYNSALGRFLSVDPLFKDYPYLSYFQCSNNSPISCIDIDGLESNKQFNKCELVNNESTNRKALAAKYGKTEAERKDPNLYFKNREQSAINNTKAMIRLVGDGLVITGGVAAVILTAGAAAPIAATIVGTLSGSMAMAGGTTKLLLDFSGQSEMANKVPTSYFGAITLTIELAIGDKKHLVSGTVSLIEGIYTWKPLDVKQLSTNLQKAGYSIDAINNIMGGIQLSQDVLETLMEKATYYNQEQPDPKVKSNKLTKQEIKDIKKYLRSLIPKSEIKKKSLNKNRRKQ